jgi:hypothetical protein
VSSVQAIAVSVQLCNRTESQPAELTQLVSNRALRVIFQTFLLALIVAIAANGVAMASNSVMNQDHCVHSASDAADSATMAMDHANHPATNGDMSPDHDHETCMMHACSAVAYEAHGAFAISVLPSAAIAVNEHPLVALERADSPLRPPNT